jgi:ribonuclease P protein component
VALPQVHRLRHRKDIDAVYQKGRRFTAPNFLVRVLLLKAAKDSPTRLGIAISTKVHKRAVVRNKVRRRFHAAFISLIPRLKTGRVMMLNVRPGIIECDYFQILRELEQVLIDAEVLHGH